MQDANQWAAAIHRALREKSGPVVCQLINPAIKIKNKNLGMQLS